VILCGKPSLNLRAIGPAHYLGGRVNKNVQDLRKNQVQGTPIATARIIQGFCGRQCTVYLVRKLMPVTGLHTQVTRPCIIARQLARQKFCKINDLRDFLDFFGFLGRPPAGGARTWLSSLEILFGFAFDFCTQKFRQSLLDVFLGHSLQVGIDINVLGSVNR
jgi:hypothetical protein